MSASAGTREDPALRRSARRWQGAGAVLLLLFVVSFPLYQAVDRPRRAQALVDRRVALETAGRNLWALNCAECHGLSGQGVDAPALNAEEFLENVSDEQIRSITAVGIPGTEMPAWWNEIGGSLTDEQIVAVVAYVRSWEETAPSRPDWRTAGTGASPSAPHSPEP